MYKHLLVIGIIIKFKNNLQKQRIIYKCDKLIFKLNL